MKTGRNQKCPCGSGRKFKHCCEGVTPWYKQPFWAALLIAAVVLGAAFLAWSQLTDPGPNTDTQDRVWSPEHGHYH